MKVLAISAGSKNGSNDAMAKEALMGAQETGVEIEFINLSDLDLKPCTGCLACMIGKDGLMQGGNGSCVVNDDMDWLAEKLYEADGIVWAVPIFESGAPGILHVVEDKLFGPTHDPGPLTIAQHIAGDMGKLGPDERKFAPKVTGFIMIGGSDWNTRVSAVMNTFAMSPMWTVVDEEVFEWAKSIVVHDDSVARCREIGTNIAKAAQDSASAAYVGAPGLCSICHSRNFYFRPSGIVECEVCGCRGRIVLDEEGYQFKFDSDQLEYVHTKMPGKMKHMDDIYKNEMQLIEDKARPEYKERMERYAVLIKGSKPEKN
jgi:multimeric flavodoxin WrbA